MRRLCEYRSLLESPIPPARTPRRKGGAEEHERRAVTAGQRRSHGPEANMPCAELDKVLSLALSSVEGTETKLCGVVVQREREQCPAPFTCPPPHLLTASTVTLASCFLSSSSPLWSSCRWRSLSSPSPSASVLSRLEQHRARSQAAFADRSPASPFLSPSYAQSGLLPYVARPSRRKEGAWTGRGALTLAPRPCVASLPLQRSTRRRHRSTGSEGESTPCPGTSGGTPSPLNSLPPSTSSCVPLRSLPLSTYPRRRSS